MSGLHAPTIPSGPTSARTTNGNAKHLSFTELQRKKENLELELKALGSVLESVCRRFSLIGNMCFVADIRAQHGVDMNTPLLTRDGFPRADIDVAQSECPMPSPDVGFRSLL
jgi:26S proteasome non-ATPase regulatory subunit 9